MIFNSIDFFLFFVAVLLGYFSIPRRQRWIWLLGASYFFYMYWSAAYALLILFSTLVDYFAAIGIYRAQSLRLKKLGLLVSCLSNLGLLFFFKYWNFFAESFAGLNQQLGLDYEIPLAHILLPVGISFYTFQTLSYTIDIYRGVLTPEYHFGRFALYVTFFPQLVAGPIERATRLLPQFQAPRAFEWNRFYSGWQRILWGLFKKVVIADRLAIYVDAVYSSPDQHHSLTCLLATYAFAIQIYCDFSGYSDIAIGAARILGYDLMENFRQPYFSQNIKEFWRRWHISLSTWLRDYLYIPLGGNQSGPGRTQLNLMIVMLLGGLWHGASWNFVIWGALQGLLLIASHFVSRPREAFWNWTAVPNRARAVVEIAFTFHLVCLSWVFFRADSFADAVTIISSVLQFDGQMPFVSTKVFAHAAIGIIVLLAVDIAQALPQHSAWQIREWFLPLRWASWYAMIFLVVLMGVESDAQFIYFQF